MAEEESKDGASKITKSFAKLNLTEPHYKTKGGTKRNFSDFMRSNPEVEKQQKERMAMTRPAKKLKLSKKSPERAVLKTSKSKAVSWKYPTQSDTLYKDPHLTTKSFEPDVLGTELINQPKNEPKMTVQQIMDLL